MIKRTTIILFAVSIILAIIAFQDIKRGTNRSYGEAQIGGSFTLTNTAGKRMKSDAFTGRFMLVYLGYSHCPDICPATLSVLSDTLKKLGDDAQKVHIVFITLDAKYDSPQALGKYLKAFDPRIIGLTGSEEEIQSVIKSFKAFSSPTENATPGNMLISHSGLLYLMDKRGKYIRHFENGVTSDTLMEALKAAF